MIHDSRREHSMKKRSHSPTRAAFVVAAVLALPTASFAQLKVIVSGGFSAAYREVLPEFERTTGLKVTTTSGASFGSDPNTIGAQLRRGVSADVVILSREGLSELISESRIVKGTDTDLAQASLGMAVRAGAPKPDISTVEALKQTLLRARSITFTSSTSGVYLTTTLFPRLGIADEMKKKSTTLGVATVAKGEAELAIQPVSELVPVAGVDFVGTLPTEVQKVNVYAAAIVAGSKETDSSKRLIAFLSSEAATAAIKKSGMEPLRTSRPSTGVR
jgi:molybdate transport system substrate-binding protein